MMCVLDRKALRVVAKIVRLILEPRVDPVGAARAARSTGPRSANRTTGCQVISSASTRARPSSVTYALPSPYRAATNAPCSNVTSKHKIGHAAAERRRHSLRDHYYYYASRLAQIQINTYIYAFICIAHIKVLQHKCRHSQRADTAQRSENIRFKLIRRVTKNDAAQTRCEETYIYIRNNLCPSRSANEWTELVLKRHIWQLCARVCCEF